MFRHGYTYSGHPAACAVAAANLDLIEREQLVARVARLAPVLARALAPLAGHDLVTEVRAGIGLLAAVEIAEDARTADPGLAPRLVAEIRERGVITRLLRGAALQISPPFVITEAEIARIAEVFGAAFDAVAVSRCNESAITAPTGCHAAGHRSRHESRSGPAGDRSFTESAIVRSVRSAEARPSLPPSGLRFPAPALRRGGQAPTHWARPGGAGRRGRPGPAGASPGC